MLPILELQLASYPISTVCQGLRMATAVFSSMSVKLSEGEIAIGRSATPSCTLTFTDFVPSPLLALRAAKLPPCGVDVTGRSTLSRICEVSKSKRS